MRYFIRLAYNGAPFHGWQRQPNAASVQQTLEEALSIVLRRHTEIVGAGRTDTGVSAREMYAHFDTDLPVADTSRLALSLSRLCGRDITIYEVIPVAEGLHARFDAIEREYKYFVRFDDNPFSGTLAWRSPSPLDVKAMNVAAKLLLKTSDFTSFAKLHSDAKTNICKVIRADWQEWSIDVGDGPRAVGIVFTITADRFLRNMVRAVVGTLVEVGRGKMDIEGFRHVIEAKDRCSAGTSMPPGALYLWRVKYPSHSFRQDLIS